MRLPFYVGSYSMPSPWVGAPAADGAGVTLATIDLGSGALEVVDAWQYPNPAFVVCSPRRGRLYAVTELERGGEVVAWQVDDELRLTGRVALDTGRDGPGHLTIDDERSVAFVTQFGGAGVSIVALDAHGDPEGLVDIIDLPLGARADTSVPSRPHCSVLIGDAELLVADYGRDQLALYAIHGGRGTTRLELVDTLDLPRGRAPRHIAKGRRADIAYVSNEDAAGISVVRIRPEQSIRRLELLQTVPSEGLGRAISLPAEIAVHPSIDVVYLANRRDESLSVFDVDTETGFLAERGAVDVEGSWPRHFATTPDGRFVVVGDQMSGTLQSFLVDATGSLRWTGHSVAVPSPTCVAFWAPLR